MRFVTAVLNPVTRKATTRRCRANATAEWLIACFPINGISTCLAA